MRKNEEGPHNGGDISERMQAPPDFAAVAAMVAAGSLLGNKVAIQPKVFDTWREHPNLWGAIVGRPGVMKTPTIRAAMRPLDEVIKMGQEGHPEKIALWQAQAEKERLRYGAMKDAIKKRLAKGEHVDASELLAPEEPPAPGLRRPLLNNCTTEALHEILRQNPNGALLFQDELTGLLARLRDPERGGEQRAFLLTAWNGDGSYTSDRIQRGLNLRVPRCCLSVLGGCQPGKIAPLVTAAVSESVDDDGFIQRFSLVVWPDIPKTYRHVDREPDEGAYAAAMEVFTRLEGIQGGDEEPYVYSFEPSAAKRFVDEFMTPLALRLRSGEETPAMESHLSKYKKAVPGLALLFELIDNEDPHCVTDASLVRALAWARYLETHARRLYDVGERTNAETAKRILHKLREGAVRRLDDKPTKWGQKPFASWCVSRPKWSGLTETTAVNAGLELLVELGWLIEVTENTGGRAASLYYPHPDVFQNAKRGTAKTEISSFCSYFSAHGARFKTYQPTR